MQQEKLTHLTKENFWNEILSNCPGEASRFFVWIDEYKQRVGWNKLFNHGYSKPFESVQHPGFNTVAPKFHDLPIGMQVGIFIDYCLSVPHRYELIEGMPGTMTDMAEQIRKFCNQEEKMFSGIKFLEMNY